MLKVAIFLKRDAGLSLDEFIASHDRHLVELYGPLIRRARCAGRHYLHPAPYPLDGVLADPAYDVFTELWFDDRPDYNGALADLSAQGAALLNDGLHGLLDASATRMAVIEEHQSRLPDEIAARPQTIRLFALLKRKPGMTLEDFIAYYETSHARLGERFVTTMGSYRRLFLRPAAFPLNAPASEADYDVVTELTFPDEAALEAAGASFATRSTMATIAEDEAKFVEPISRRLVSVQTF